MQIAAKTTLLLIFFYLVGLTGAAIWLEQDYEETSREVMGETAELIAEQIGNVLYEPIIDQLMARDEDAFHELSQLVESTVDRSVEIKSLAVVDASGELVVGGKENVAYPTPEARFSEDPTVQVISRFDRKNRADRHIAYVPIKRRGSLAGYIKLILGNKSIARLFDRLTNRLINFALVGLVAILILGALLHVELSRIGSQLVRFMTEDSDKSYKQPRDEFFDLRNHARLLGERSRENDQNLGLLSQALRVGLVLIDREDKAVFASPSAQELLAVGSRDEIKIKRAETWKLIIAAANQLRHEDNFSTSIKVEIVTSDHPKTLLVELLKADKSVQHVLVLIRDQNTVQALDENLRAATRMHTLSSIYLGAAHDLRSPISAMVMNLELLEDSVEETVNAASKINRERYISVLKDELQRLQRFLDSFLASATVSKNSGREAVELSTIVEDLIRLFLVQAKQLGINVKHQLPGESVYIFAASEQIRQVLMNLLVNAYEAMPEGGELDLSLVVESDQAVIVVADTGGGIPSTLLDSIFEMHFTTKSTGTGIGLYVARNVIEQHNGSITVESELGKGTQFIVRLPLHEIDANGVLSII